MLLKNLSHQNQKILLIPVTTHKVALLSDDIDVDDAWSIPSTFPQQSVKQIEVIQDWVLSEVSIYKLKNDWVHLPYLRVVEVMNKQ